MRGSHLVLSENEEGEMGVGEVNSDSEIDHVQVTVLWRALD